MSDQKISPNRIINAGAMTGPLTSAVLDISQTDNVGLQMAWTGTPTGTLVVECSIDGTNWVALNLPTISTGGGANSALLDLVGLCSSKLRVRYNFSSGTGSLNVTAHGKGI